MTRHAKVYKPLKKMEEYLPYFIYEKDEKLEGIGYLLKDVVIELDSALWKLAIQGIERQYNYFNSEFRKELELQGLEFKYVLLENQSSYYSLVMNDTAKEYVRKAVLNIANIEGKLEEMVIVLADGSLYGNVDAFESLNQEGIDFLNQLINNKLIKKKTIKINQETVSLDDITEIE